MDGDRLGMAITNRAARCGSSPRCRVDVKAARAGSIPAPSSNSVICATHDGGGKDGGRCTT